MTSEDAPLPRLIAYARTSTADQQNPKESLRWQLDAARTLTAGRAEIVEVVHDVDTSRSLPWSQRPQASALLGQLPDPRRNWSGIVVGEPQCAFGDTGQVQTVLAQLHHYGVELWIPELQGPVDPNSEIHDIILSLFGGLSRAERNRLRVRVRTAMRAMAPEGRYLGGRPPYGYQLVRTGVAHPNPEKARQGIQLTRLAVDPETSLVVKQIFAWRAEGLGFRAIASRLTDAGIACPSAADRERNPHRLGLAWSVHAVRAIVINPKYKGQQTYGRYHKVERLRNVDNPAAGNLTREVPSDPDDILAIDDAIDAIVNPDQWQAAQPGASPAAPGPRPAPANPTKPDHRFEERRGRLPLRPARHARLRALRQAHARRLIPVAKPSPASATAASTEPSTPATRTTPAPSSSPKAGSSTSSTTGSPSSAPRTSTTPSPRCSNTPQDQTANHPKSDAPARSPAKHRTSSAATSTPSRKAWTRPST